MQKWIRDRMRRRKKKNQPDSGAATQTPLQPVYPEPLQPSDGTQDLPEPAVTTDSTPVEPSDAASGSSPAPARTRRRRKKKSPQPAEQTQAESAAAEDSAQPSAVEQHGEHTESTSADTAVGSIVHDSPAPPEAQQAAPVRKPQRASKGAVVLAVGLPGSGKTTWYKRRDVTPLSSDAVRQLLFDDPTEQHHQDLVFGTLRSLLRARLIARMPMNYVDATNLSPKERRHWIKMARDFGYEVQAVYFDVPLEVCMERNQRRNRIVPEDVMHRMAAKLKPPTFDEGFSKIIVVRVKHRPAEAPVGQQTGEHEGVPETE